MANKNFFVALKDGAPYSQRSSARDYLSSDGASYSSKPVSPDFPLAVAKVAKALEWVATVTWEDGTTETHKSKAHGFPDFYVEWESVEKATGKVDKMSPRFSADLEKFQADRPDHIHTYRVTRVGKVTQVLKNWPQA